MVGFNNSLINNFEINVLVSDLNESLSTHSSQSDINILIDQLAQILKDSPASTTDKKEIIKLIDKEFKHIQKDLKIKAGLIPQKDIICSKSQGRLDSKGQSACAVICQKALVHYLSGKPIATKEDMYFIMKEGIQEYKNQNFEGKLYFDESFEKVNQNSSFKLIALAPEGYTKDESFLELMRDNPISIPMEGVVKDGFTSVLNVLNTTASTHDQKAGGVLTCNGETIVVLFPEKDKPILFDSHGRRYNDEDRGASLRKFNSTEELDHYLKTIFKNPNDNFTMVIVGTEETTSDTENDVQSSTSSEESESNYIFEDALSDDIFEDAFEFIEIPSEVNIFPKLSWVQSKFASLFHK